MRATPTTIAELLAFWASGEGKPYKGYLIDREASWDAGLNCMCAQGDGAVVLRPGIPRRQAPLLVGAMAICDEA